MHPTAIYIHIPFCIRKCLYCDFTSYHGKEAIIPEYVEALKKEIRLEAELHPSPRISTIYFGGGTPNVLSPEQLGSILDQVKESFPVALDAEISTEANPGRLRLQTAVCSLQSLKNTGFNRLSMGVQSLNDHELALLGRIHTAAEAVQAYSDARESGFENISIDLMYGIPDQTFESWQQTLNGVLDLHPQHISLYSLTVEENTPYWDMCQSGRLSLPGDDTEADMYEEAIRRLTNAGFVHYEISNFAKPGFECRHNITYWQNNPYYGFGAGATSYLKGVRATNFPFVEKYIANIFDGQVVKETEECLSTRGAMGETMFLGLRMLQGVDVDAFTRRYGVPPQQAFPAEIAALLEHGLIEEIAGSIRLTRTGLLFANDVFSEFVG